MRFSKSSRLLTAAACISLMPAASAQLAPYSQDFEGLLPGQDNFIVDPADNELSNDGWVVFGQVFDPTGTTFLFDYGSTQPAPNTDGASFAFCGVKDAAVPDPIHSHVTAAQGAKHLNLANNYQDPRHADSSNNVVVSTTFQEQNITAAADGQTWTFSFDATLPNNPFNFVGPADPTNQSIAFLRIVDPANPTAPPTLLGELDASTLNDTDWVRTNFTYTFNSSDAGKVLQFGFETRAQSGSPTGTYYDNIAFFQGVPPDPEPEPSPAAVPMPLAGLIALGALLGLGGFAATRRRAG